MDPTQAFCPHAGCPARGQTGKGNITLHSQKEQRYRCTVCRHTFSARAGTPFYRRRTEEEVLTLVVTLVVHGCPVAAIEAALRTTTIDAQGGQGDSSPLARTTCPPSTWWTSSTAGVS